MKNIKIINDKLQNKTVLLHAKAMLVTIILLSTANHFIDIRDLIVKIDDDYIDNAILIGAVLAVYVFIFHKVKKYLK